MSGALVQMEAASFGYQGRPVVQRASLTISPREFVAIAGSNGSGKTTLLRGLLGLLPPLAGRVERRPELRIGYVPQRETLDPLYPLSAYEVTLLGTYRDLPFWRRTGAAERSRAREALDACRALDLARRRYGELSGGQRQRVLMARALASEPDLLLLDEPTAGVDPAAEQAILDLLGELRGRSDLAIWMVTHHLHALERRVDRWVRMEGGQIVPEEAACSTS